MNEEFEFGEEGIDEATAVLTECGAVIEEGVIDMPSDVELTPHQRAAMLHLLHEWDFMVVERVQ